MIKATISRTAQLARIGTVAIVAACAAFAFAAPAAEAHGKAKHETRDPARDVAPPAPLPKLNVPSPGNSEAGSPVRDYIYRPPSDSGDITRRLVPPGTVR